MINKEGLLDYQILRVQIFVDTSYGKIFIIFRSNLQYRSIYTKWIDYKNESSDFEEIRQSRHKIQSKVNNKSNFILIKGDNVSNIFQLYISYVFGDFNFLVKHLWVHFYHIIIQSHFHTYSRTHYLWQSLNTKFRKTRYT